MDTSAIVGIPISRVLFGFEEKAVVSGNSRFFCCHK